MIPDKLKLKQFLGLSPKLKLQTELPTEHHGSEYGGWTIRQNSLNKNSEVISAGIGNDISFDLSVIEKYDVNILAIDPTPAVGDWLEKQSLPSNFIYMPQGLDGKDGEVKFFEPSNKEHISHSAKPSGNGNNYIIVSVTSITSLVSKHKLTKIDLLKMDIEGFEYAVIDDIIQNDLPIEQLLIEFHHGLYGFSVADTANAVNKLNKAGYSIFAISSTGREISFTKN